MKSAQRELRNRKIQLERLNYKDDVVLGLTYIITKHDVSAHVSYVARGQPNTFRIGSLPELSIEEARKIAKHVQKRAKAGIDVQKQSQQRLLSDLRRAA